MAVLPSNRGSPTFTVRLLQSRRDAGMKKGHASANPSRAVLRVPLPLNPLVISPPPSSISLVKHAIGSAFGLPAILRLSLF